MKQMKADQANQVPLTTDEQANRLKPLFKSSLKAAFMQMAGKRADSDFCGMRSQEERLRNAMAAIFTRPFRAD